VLSNGHHHDTDLSHSIQCRVCGASPQPLGLVDVYGAALCESCLRRMDADPRQKRRIMLSMSDAFYW